MVFKNKIIYYKSDQLKDVYEYEVYEIEMKERNSQNINKKNIFLHTTHA